MDMPNMQELMEKAKEMQEQMQKAQTEITSLKISGEAGGGLVKISMNGAHQALRVEIAEAAMEDKDMLEDLILASINDATKKVEAAIKDKMMGMAKDLQLPEGFDGSSE